MKLAYIEMRIPLGKQNMRGSVCIPINQDI